MFSELPQASQIHKIVVRSIFGLRKIDQVSYRERDNSKLRRTQESQYYRHALNVFQAGVELFDNFLP